MRVRRQSVAVFFRVAGSAGKVLRRQELEAGVLSYLYKDYRQANTFSPSLSG